VARLAVLSYHTSPLAQPGTGDGGGMNVYVRELSTALARLGHDVDVFTRRDDASSRHDVVVEPGFRVRYVTAGPPRPLERHELPAFVGEFTDAVAAKFRCGGAPEAIHANYWLSGVAGHRLKHEFSVPLIMTFHTLEQVKAATFEVESAARAAAEAKIVGCSDAILASCDVEAEQIIRHYDADVQRVHVVPLGVEHAFFAPGFRPQARRALGFAPAVPLLLFVGRLQLLKGVDLALETLIELHRRDTPVHLAIVGGPSGPTGRATLEHLRRRVSEAGVIDDVTFVAPQPHELLSTWFRAADVTLVPSRAESFGLVALESSACGTPVVASSVGGLTTLVESQVNGLLVDDRAPEHWADAVAWVLDDERSTSLSTSAVLLAREYTWRSAARDVAALSASLAGTQLVSCP
jgi:D-inositol-3-phosphate glycosyltransferase